MKRFLRVSSFLFWALLLSPCGWAGTEAPLIDLSNAPESSQTMVSTQYVVLLGSFHEYAKAVQKGKEIAKLTGVRYDGRGTYYNPKRGILFVKDSENGETDDGYVPRKEGQDSISVEYAADYEDQPTAEFALIGAVADSQDEATTLLGNYRKAVPAARLLTVEMADNPDAENASVQMFIVTLGQSNDYKALVAKAKELSKETGIKYDDEGLVLDAKRGLILPDDADDDIWAGDYYPRRYNSRYLSVERSKYYLDKPKGKYVIVGFMDMEPREGRRMLQWFKKYEPSAFFSHELFYQGCIH